MTVRRVVPNFQTHLPEEHHEFYGLLGLEEVMNQGWSVTLASPSVPTAQVSFLTHDVLGHR